MNPLHYSHHEGISCDHCMKSNFRGKRYKCLVCPDYDLCSSCYESGTVPAGKRHTSKHPVQCILTRNDFEIHFGSETTPVEQVQSFTCPICGKMGFTQSLLYDHAMQEHSDTLTEVSCPICCSIQNVEPAQTIEDFTSHLSIEHRSGRSYDTPQTSLRGRRVPHTNRGVNQNRNRRQITPTAVTMLSNINPLLSSLPHDQAVGGLSGVASSQISQIRDLDPITELLAQLRRSQNVSQSALSSNSFNSSSPNALHLHLDHRSFRGNTLRQVFDRTSATDIVVRRHNQTALGQQANQSSLNAAYPDSLYYLLADNQMTSGQSVPNSNNLSNQGQASSNQFQFLLSTCKEKPKISKELENDQRREKSLFIQELLISSIENFFKHDLKFQRSSDNRISLDQCRAEKTEQERAQSETRANDGQTKGLNEKGEPQKEEQIKCQNESEASSSNNNCLVSDGSKDLSLINPATNKAAKMTNGQQSQQVNESNQSNNQPSNNQEPNNQIAKSDNNGGSANSETVDLTNSSNRVNNESSSTPVSRIKRGHPLDEPRSDQEPSKW